MLALAAATSSPALADAGVPDMPVTSITDLTEATTAVLDEAGLPELDSLAAVDPSIALPAVPAQKAAAEPVTAGAVAAPPPEPAAEAPVQAAPDPIPAPDAPPAGGVAHTGPTNVNVSVRVNSPGDNGSVEQANVATVVGGAPATETAPQYQPEPPQYQEPIPVSTVPESEAAPQPPAVDPAQTADGWNWNWEWNCGDAIPEMSVPPEVGSQNWNWNWDWNCGEADPIPTNSAEEKPPQYQPGVTQYRPININISIRINSPGNDGGVKQTNVAVLVAAPVLPALRVEVPVPAPVGAQTAVTPLGADSQAETLVSPGAFIAQMFTAAELPLVAEDCCFGDDSRDLPSTVAEPESVLLPQAPPAARRDTTARERFSASIAVTVRLAKASEAAARVARPAPKPAQLRPAPRRPAAPAREQAAAMSAAGFAPLNASDGRLGQLLLLIATFAFVIALADATRSVAAEVRAAGEDPDRPPDHPG